MSFQKQVYTQPAIGIAGDFANTNPRFTVAAGPGGIVAGNNLFVGRFAWATTPIDLDGSPTVANCNGTGTVTGFVHRDQQGLLTNYLQEASLQVPAGFQVTLYNGGDFLVTNDGSGQCNIGMKAYANFATGKISFAATGAPTSGGSVTGTIGATTGSFTGSIAGNIMTISAVGSGSVVVGGTLSGTNVASGTMVVNQLTGSAGQQGTYTVSINDQVVAATTISETYGLFTAVSGLTGSFAVGDVLSGSGGGGVTAGTYITALGTGTGGLGTYVVTPTQGVTSSTIAATANVETKWVAMGSGPAGSIIKISDHVLG